VIYKVAVVVGNVDAFDGNAFNVTDRHTVPRRSRPSLSTALSERKSAYDRSFRRAVLDVVARVHRQVTGRLDINHTVLAYYTDAKYQSHQHPAYIDLLFILHTKIQ